VLSGTWNNKVVRLSQLVANSAHRPGQDSRRKAAPLIRESSELLGIAWNLLQFIRRGTSRNAVTGKTSASKRNDGSIDLNASVRGMSGKRRICHISGQRLYAELINRHLNDNAWSKVDDLRELRRVTPQVCRPSLTLRVRVTRKVADTTFTS